MFDYGETIAGKTPQGVAYTEYRGCGWRYFEADIPLGPINRSGQRHGSVTLGDITIYKTSYRDGTVRTMQLVDGNHVEAITHSDNQQNSELKITINEKLGFIGSRDQKNGTIIRSWYDGSGQKMCETGKWPDGTGYREDRTPQGVVRHERYFENGVFCEVRAAPPVSFEQALSFFDRLADREDIAFGFAADGCYARAHLMCEEAKKLGLSPQKVWAFEDKAPLSVKLPDATTVNWWYHVALSLPVKMPDGSVKNLVFDPGLFDGPTSPQSWGQIMGADSNQLQINPSWASAKGHKGDYTPTISTRECLSPESRYNPQKKMAEYLEFQGPSRVVFPSPEVWKILPLPVAQQRKGARWKSTWTLDDRQNPQQRACSSGRQVRSSTPCA